MTVSIMAFGIVREIFGSSSIVMDVHDGCSVQTLKQDLQSKFPGLADLSSFLIAVNNHYATGEQQLVPEDEIAVIPPVSGG
ncbi:MAG: MoaD/ThiS family protein [Chitinophagales bacterium]|nr:MoaD/ThiS family protein [Chitinophagales bacterium]